MFVSNKTNRKLRLGCRFEKCELATERDCSRDLFSREWEVFVIKRDETTGKLVGRLACCALSPV